MAPRQIPTSQAVLGLTLFASIALPMTRSGESLLDIILLIGRSNPVSALIVLAMFGSPHLFGLAVAVTRLLRDESTAVRVVQVAVMVLQGMLVLASTSALKASGSLAPLALAGFALVTSVYFLVASAEAAASSRGGLSLHWYIRWGALLVAGTGLWLRLQAGRGLYLGPSLDAAVVAAGLLLVSTARRQRPLAASAGFDAAI